MFNDPEIAAHWKEEQLFVLSSVLTAKTIGRISKFFVSVFCAMQTFQSICALLLERMTFNPRCLAL